MKVTAVIPSAGKGTRLNRTCDKPFVRLAGRELLAHTIEAFEKSDMIQSVVLVVSPDFIRRAAVMVKKYGFRKVTAIVKGGARRADSVRNGLDAVSADTDIVAIHDGARPCVSAPEISLAVKAAGRYGGACVCVKAKPTLKMEGKGRTIARTIDRSRVWEAQTPQVFTRSVIMEAYRNSKAVAKATDDSGLVEKLGYKVKIVPGSYGNIKVTTKEDLLLAEALLKELS